jgi:hypothetical protein
MTKNAAAITTKPARQLELVLINVNAIRRINMDLTDLNQKTREARLPFGEASALVRYRNFLRERNDESQVSDSYDRICETLSALYPALSFDFDDHIISVRVKGGVSGTPVENIGFVTSKVAHRITKVTFDSDEIYVVFRADGIGIIKEGSWYEFFEHGLDLAEVEREFRKDNDAIGNFLHDYFINEVSENLEDPFINPSEEGCELYFETGSREELDRLMRLFILTEPDIEAHEDKEVRLYSAVEDDSPHLESYQCYSSRRLTELTEIALSEHQPIGWSWEYNDGAYNRRSGYDRQAHCLTWNIGEILEQSLAREKMAARRDLRLYLAARGYEMADFDAMAKERGAE